MDHQLQEERIPTPQNMWSLLEKGGWAGHQRESSALRVFQVKVQTDAGSTISTAGTQSTELQSSENYSVETAAHS
jgi:hypothetical protein